MSRYNYLLFHSIAEIFSVVIAFGIFVIAWNSRGLTPNAYLLFIGIGYLFVGGIDLVHTISYKGMGVFPRETANLPTQLWVAARFLESITLFIAPWLQGRRIRWSGVFAGFAVGSSILLASIFLRVFPACYLEGSGLTPFKKGSEYAISVILALALFLLFRQRKAFDARVARFLILSIALTIFSEVAFTFYVGVYDLSNLAGHLLKILSFYLIYEAIIKTGLVEPYHLIFRDLKRSQESLQQKTAELAAANQDLESFSYSVAHDLRAPLRAINGFSRIFVEDYGATLDAEGRRLLSVIQANTSKMGQLIDDLLMFSRLGRQDLKVSPVDFQSLAESVFRELQAESRARTIQFRPGELHTAQGDPAMIRQVVRNLFSNALKFTRTQAAAVLEISSARGQGEIIFSVKDNGVGFDPKYAAKLFGVFQRLHSTEEFEGNGVGLAIVERIIRRHGGRVWAEGKPGVGATFYFSLPENETASQ